ncbi:MAG: hypothetical protein KGN84_08110 [Acidobacteriota bacterium]|nr:hypothetical protein [Acidobacteriota bacterium]
MAFAGTLAADTAVSGFGGVRASMANNGAWSVSAPAYGWTFAGSLGTNAFAPHANSGADNLGDYQEIAFAYSASGAARAGAIRVYPGRPVVQFFSLYPNGGANTAPFPAISTYPAMSRLSFDGEFARPNFLNLTQDSPWVWFDGSYRTWILSPAANYMTASNRLVGAGTIAAGIDPAIASLPPGFTHATALVFGEGINATFGNWGQALLDLTGKKPAGNQADALLKYVSYWTDNGATYYYNPGPSLYMATLDSIRREFDTIGVRLGSMQLDSWWYPKGPDNSWSSHQGIWTYTASPALFQPDLASFQAGLGVPLATHARWIDSRSPYRSQYTISGNVATDPRYWEDIAAYLKAAKTAVYEQDWLGDAAHTAANLTDPYLFLGNMSASMAARGIDIQYCMALPKHFLQSTAYGNVTTIRTSQDRFGPDRWTWFFYANRLASSLGVWPYADVLMSGETTNMIAALLSGGPIGLGDAIGTLSRTNIRMAARADGAIVKPDVAATPLDSVFVADANGQDTPMVAASSTDFGNGWKAQYIFAYPRGANNTVTIDPHAFGMTGANVLYDSLGRSAIYLGAGQTWTGTLAGPAYYVLAPIGPSGIGFLGDSGQFVTLGRERVASVGDSGALAAVISFAPGEKVRKVFGYASQAIGVQSLAGSHYAVTWDSTSGLFQFAVTPGPHHSAHFEIRPAGVTPVPSAPATGSGISAAKDSR